MGLGLHSMCDLPEPGMEPVSPARAGRLLTTEPPGNPEEFSFNIYCQAGLLTTNSLNFFFFWSEKTFISFSLLEDNFRVQNSRLVVFSLYTLNVSLYSPFLGFFPE